MESSRFFAIVTSPVTGLLEKIDLVEECFAIEFSLLKIEFEILA